MRFIASHLTSLCRIKPLWNYYSDYRILVNFFKTSKTHRTGCYNSIDRSSLLFTNKRWLRTLLKNHFSFRTVFFGWGFPKWVIMKRYASGKNFKTNGRRISIFRLINGSHGRIDITPLNYVKSNSSWCHIEAHLST